MLTILQVLDSPRINFLLLIKEELSNFLGGLLIWTILAFILYIVVFYEAWINFYSKLLMLIIVS